MIKQNMKHLNRITVLVDAVLIVAALYLSWYIRIESGLMAIKGFVLPFTDYMRPALFLVPVYLILYKSFDVYGPHSRKSLYDILFNLLKANIVGVLIFFAYLYTFRVIDYSRKLLVIFFFVSIVLGALGRLLSKIIIYRFFSKRRHLKRIAFIGYGDLAVEYSKRIMMNPHWGYSIAGVFDEVAQTKYLHLYKRSYRHLGSFDKIESYINDNELDEMVITLPLDQYDKLEVITNICERNGVYTRLIPDYYKIIPAKPYVEDIDGLPVISLREVPLNDIMKKAFKRTLDLSVAIGGIIVLSPMFLILSLIIKLTSKGPVIYSQERVGINRQVFRMYKFRSMVQQSEADEKKGWTKKGDPRVTGIGKFIRRTSIDEFPQLINVIKGDMSLIGPRPERPQFVEQYRDEIPKYMVKHQVRPGMTGWAQIHGLRGDTSIEKRIEYDLYYIENWSMKLEIKIFFMTFWKGFINHNAY